MNPCERGCRDDDDSASLTQAKNLMHAKSCRRLNKLLEYLQQHTRRVRSLGKKRLKGSMLDNHIADGLQFRSSSLLLLKQFFPS